MNLRRQFELPPEDEEFLNHYGLPWETIVDGSPWVLIHDFPTHAGYNHATVTAAIRIETGYPNAELHMVYFFLALVRTDGKPIGATQNACSSSTARASSGGRGTGRRRTPGR